MKNELSIVITTYNRRKQLNRLLKSLVNIPRTFYQEIVIIDNNSNYNISQLLKNYSQLDIRLVRNKVNIGMSTNIVSPFIHANTKWVWTLSDDDVVLPESLSLINKELCEIEPNIGLIKFSIDNFRSNKEFIAEDLSSLIDYYYENKNLRSGELVFISNSVYNLEKISDYLHYGFTYSYTYVGFLIPILKALNDQIVRVKFSSSSIIEYKHPEGDGYSLNTVALGLSTITDIGFDLDRKTRKMLNVLLMSIPYKWFIANFFLKDSINLQVFIKLCRNIYLPNLPFDRKIVIYIFLIYVKIFGYFFNPILRKIYKLKNQF